ncbi:MAG: class I SAM-dependent methyltransferase [Acidimicrobiales bacterium]
MTDTLPLRTASRAVEIVDRLHADLSSAGHAFPIRRWDGVALGADDAGWRLVLEHPWSLRSLLLPPTDRNAGEAYVFGDVDVEGSMIAAIREVARLRALPVPLWDRLAMAARLRRLPPRPEAAGLRRFRPRGRKHSTGRDTQAVRFHYDVGNDFYRLFLDRNLVYSCAYFDEADRAAPRADEQLDRAQVRKLDLICRKLDLRPGERLLDIGCGWGSLVIHAASRFGVQALGITLSEPQAELANERIRAAGLEGRAEAIVADYREVEGTFDAVASIGMVEHVGAARLGAYFDRAFSLTGTGGRFLNHGITTGRRMEVRDLSRDRHSFIGAYVFPDGALVPAHLAVERMERSGFELLDVEQLRPHYARTLTHWVDRLERRADQARAEVGDATYRTWRAYMAGSVVGFETDDLGVVQVLGGKGWRPPWGRAHQLPQV